MLPEQRGAGAMRALLRVADAYHALGLPVRVKTGRVAVHEVFVRCAALAYAASLP